MFDRKILSLPGARGALAFCIVVSVLQSALVVGQAFSLSHAIVGVWQGGALAGQLPAVAVFALCFCGRAVVRAAQEARMEGFAHARVSSLRSGLLENLFDTGGAASAAFGSADVVVGAVDGCNKAEAYISKVFPKAVSMVVVPFCICVAVFSQDAVSGVIVLVCYPFIIAFMRLIGYTASDASARRHEGFVEMSGHFMDSLRGMETLRAFGVASAYSSSVFAASERYRKMVMKTLRTAQLSGAVLDVFATCGLAAVAIMLGFRMVEGSLAFLPALAVLMLVPEYFMSIKAYASDYHASLDGKSALDRLVGLAGCRRGGVALPGASICVGEGDKVAVVGASGSGKSSLLDVVSGARDLLEGSVSVCGTSGAGLASEAWRARVAYIPQHPYVFSGTLRDNVALYAPDASDEEVADALSMVGLDGLVESLPSGIHSEVGARGRALSGGEAHRVALARAVAGGRDVWLLDEPGSSLDELTELDLKEAILPLMEGRTVMVATHRDHWLRDMDAVVDVDAMPGVAHG